MAFFCPTLELAESCSDPDFETKLSKSVFKFVISLFAVSILEKLSSCKSNLVFLRRKKINCYTSNIRLLTSFFCKL